MAEAPGEVASIEDTSAERYLSAQTVAERSRISRTTNESYREREVKRVKEYRSTLTDEKRKQYNEKAKERMKKYRAKRKMLQTDSNLQTENSKRQPTSERRCLDEEEEEEEKGGGETEEVDEEIHIPVYQSKPATAQKRKLNEETGAAQDNNDNHVIHTLSVCDSCGTNENVNHFCINCPGNLCETCKNSHTYVNLYKTHRVVKRSDQTIVKSLSSTKSTCELHSEEILMFCKQCKTPCCLECIAMNHKAHDMMHIADAYKEAKQELSMYLEKIEEDFLPIPAKLISIIQIRKTNMQKRKRNSETYAATTIKKVQSDLDRIEHYMTERITSIFEREEKDLLKLKHDVYQNERKVNDVTQKYLKVLKESSEQTVLTANEDKPDLQSIELPQLTLPTSYNLEEDSWDLEIEQKLYGDFEEKVNDMVLYDPKSKSGHAIPLSSLKFDPCMIDPKVIVTLVFDECSNLFSQRPHMYWGDTDSMKIVVTNNAKLWMSYQSLVTLYETCNGEIEEEMVVPVQFSRIYDLAVTEDNGIVATDERGKSIIRVSSTGYVTKCCLTAPYTPWCIHVNNKQEVIVGEELEGRSKLIVYSPDLKEVVREIETDSSSGCPLFRNEIKKLVQNGNGDYVGIEKDLGVVCVSSDGVWRWQYKQCYLCDVACDKYHNVLVLCEDEGNIGILSSDGQLIQRIADVLFPKAFTIDTIGILWILHYDGDENTVISKFKYLD